MTASASASKTLSANYGSYTLSVSWSESNPNVTTNRSKITASATLSSSNTAFASNYNQHISVYWFDNNQYPNGIKIAGTDFKSCGMSPYTSQSASGSIEVPHKDDGTLSGYCLTYFTNNNGGPYAPASNSCSTSTKSLDTIARASIASADPNPLYVGNGSNPVTIYTNRKSSSFTHQITLTCGSWTTTSPDNIQTEVQFDIPYIVLAQFANNQLEKSCTITCVTKNGDTLIGSKDTTLTLSVDSNVDHPAIGTIVLADTNPRTSALLSAGQFANGISTLEATIPLTVSGSYTELSEAVVTCGDLTQTFALSGTSQTITFTFDKVNDSSLTVVVKDKRGNQVSATESWTLLQYQPITATATVGRPSATGATAVGQVNGTGYAETYGSTPNSVTIVVDFKEPLEANYHDSETFTEALTGSGADTYTKAMTFAFSFDYQKEYDIRFTVSDLFSTAVYYCRLMQGLPILSWDETEVDVWGNLHIHDRDNPTTYQDVLQGFNAVLEHSGIKNLLTPIINAITSAGVTFTPQDDGSVKVVGTASAETWSNYSEVTLQEGSYVLTGGDDDVHVELWDDTGSNLLGVAPYAFDVNSEETYRVYCEVANGLEVDSVVYPMIQDARIADKTFVPNPFIEMARHIIKYDTSGIWTRIQLGKILILICNNSIGGQINFGVTYDSVPWVLTGAAQGSYGHGNANMQLWDITTSSLKWDAYYGSGTKYPATIMVVGFYSGQIGG